MYMHVKAVSHFHSHDTYLAIQSEAVSYREFMIPEYNLYKYLDIHACIQIKGGIIITGFVEIAPVTSRPSPSSFLRIIRALIFFCRCKPCEYE